MYRGPAGKEGGRTRASNGVSNLVCEPPLGQVTLIADTSRNVRFTVLLEPEKGCSSTQWDVVLWHNWTSSGEWTGLQFEKAKHDAPLFHFGSQSNQGGQRHYFAANLNGPSGSGPHHFTAKFRSNGGEWQWVNDGSSLEDGEIIFYTGVSTSPELGDFIDNLSGAVTVKSEPSEVPDTYLWSLDAPVPPAEGSKSAFGELPLGKPRDFSRWMGLVRLWSPWLSPEQGRSDFAPTKDVILCSFLLRSGLNLVLLALSGIDDVMTLFKGDAQGNVLLLGRNDSPERGKSRILISVGNDHESAVAATMYEARRIVEAKDILTNEVQAHINTAKDRIEPQWLENWYDGFTYCTWNGLGQDLKEENIYKALTSLQENKIIITNLIIDDNWQSLDNEGQSQFRRGWTDFDANKKGFPRGLKHTVFKIRQDYPHIQHISVWHAILGYWGGIAPNGNISKNYKTAKVDMKTGVRPPGGPMVVVDEEDVPRMYEDFYKFLSECGIDSVKTDAQFFLDEMEEADVRRRLIKTYQDAWAVSSLRWFSIKAISCMSQTPQILFHSQLPTNKPPILVRNSDDFFPEIAASHPWHIFCNAHNAILTRFLNLLPDWDMFQTDHPWSTFHAAARCLSGGPIYITDEPGKHDIGLIHQMTARTIRGSTVIIRPQNLGRSMLHYVRYDEERLLRIGTYSGGQRTGTGILGVFNVGQSALTELIPLIDFPGTLKGCEYVVRAHFSGELSPPLKLNDNTPLLGIHVPVRGCEILSCFPIQTLDISGGASRPESSQRKVASLGLLGKMTGAAAVLSTRISTTETGNLKLNTTVKALGTLGIYISDLPSLTIQENFLVTILGHVVPIHTVRKSQASDRVLEIDVEKAWDEMGLKSGWSNEVDVTVVASAASVKVSP